ncbi:OmpA family protein [Flagellimonas olearia]|uniref:OmpA family protein n=1 Tax=Flagellimonas olearia TaxID=552546 RepID=A0A6I1DXJ9_9FLAO|nr:OmpA family protein [Allomuricauda olearia]KAB7530213.1 OmpA family protein [Allomuricauda olearia]
MGSLILNATKVLLFFVLAAQLTSCKDKGNAGNKNDRAGDISVQETQATDRSGVSDEIDAEKSKFDIDNIPISKTDLGDFPFFGLPEGLVTTNSPIQRNYDVLYVAVDGIMTPFEGKVWKTYVSAEGGYDAWSLPYFQKSYDDIITSVGGVKIFDGKISYEEYERYHGDAVYMGEDGSIGYTDQRIKTYVIRRSDGGDIYVQMTGDGVSGSLNILQKKPFEQTITILKSEKIQRDLEETGKVVLYINFELDKAVLTSKGKEAVDEVAKVLQGDKELKISIHGYTDSSGEETHNQKLSESRARTVMAELIAMGIATERLSSLGHGSQNPLADNGTDEGRAKNRRVELIKQ